MDRCLGSSPAALELATLGESLLSGACVKEEREIRGCPLSEEQAQAYAHPAPTLETSLVGKEAVTAEKGVMSLISRRGSGLHLEQAG